MVQLGWVGHWTVALFALAQFGNAEKLAAVCIEAAAASAQWTSFEQMLLWKFVHAEFTEWSKYAPTPIDHLTHTHFRTHRRWSGLRARPCRACWRSELESSVVLITIAALSASPHNHDALNGLLLFLAHFAPTPKLVETVRNCAVVAIRLRRPIPSCILRRSGHAR